MEKTVVLKKTETGKVIFKDSTSCLKDFLYGRIVSGCCTIMVKKSVLISNKLWFANGYKYSEDLHMLWRIIASSRKVAYLDKHLYIYKLQDNSATSRFDSERFHGYQLIKSLENFFEINVPQFAPEYKKYATAKLMWSISWQEAVNYELNEFIDFAHTYNLKNEMKRLVFFKSGKVALSSLLFIMSPSIFRKMAIKFGKKHVH